ncbi:RNA methyltransferase [Pelomicrobium methylotrophicum]|uniref:tRNA (cytidine/uridine-2'-O-)-methyltransferase TrmJ n=1 Tax=Pelomicrobium methylotrophicum TaxID=2602750 RepID=A0A5C7EUC7_9PROT|nr:RNA methyltransferase [Pelomicrobium methylotrophicum]TXF12350.1 RNA methyltransferase [Pelomicrobium methylotrophicum]
MNKPDPLQNVRVVLVCTSHPGNIGAAARAMKTMGLETLYLVRPRRFPDSEATAMASAAVDVLERARLCDTLDEALEGTVLAAGLTARRRDLAPRLLTPRAAAPELLGAAQAGPVAVVFGNEANGLTSEELQRCQIVVHIPGNPRYNSLNLGAAVQVMCYELRMAIPELACVEVPAFEPARHEDVEQFYAHLERTLLAVGFLDPRQPKRLMQRLRRLFARARLEKEEVNILRGILKAVGGE